MLLLSDFSPNGGAFLFFIQSFLRFYFSFILFFSPFKTGMSELIN